MTPTTLVLLLTAVPLSDAVKVLFIGNSFTYVNDLPHTLVAVAKSKGKSITVDNSTIGGCTLYYQKDDARTKQLLQQEWDVIALQDYSLLPTVAAARQEYFYPAVSEIAAQKKQAKVLAYNTWGYIGGLTSACPSSDAPTCFPLGTLADLTGDCATSSRYEDEVGGFDCMTYSLARGYLAAFDHGADAVAPCGISWQVARGSSAVPAGCRAAIDAEYPSPFGVPLPVNISGQTAPTKDIMLYRDNGKDKHPSPAGQYLNACVFFAMIFGESPVGAASIAGVSADEALGLQQVAAGVVLQHRALWFNERSNAFYF